LNTRIGTLRSLRTQTGDFPAFAKASFS
jgi:hypothetical protein